MIDRLVSGLRTDPQFGVLNLARWGDAMPRPSQVVNPDEDATPTRTIPTTPDTSGGTGSGAESPMAYRHRPITSRPVSPFSRSASMPQNGQ